MTAWGLIRRIVQRLKSALGLRRSDNADRQAERNAERAYRQLQREISALMDEGGYI